jgi:hypothetical protein
MTTNNTAFDFGSGNFTIQVWVNFNSVSSEQTLLEKFSGSGGPGWTLTTPGGSDLQFYTAGGAILNFGLTIPTGVWQQFVAERNGNTWGLFWDGNLVTSAINSGSIIPSTNPLLFGARDSADGRNFTLNGTEDEVAIWDRALSAQEINALWNGGAGTQVPEPGTLVLLSSGLLGLAGIRLRRTVR